MSSPYYVTTPIYYVNGPPHIGHIYTTVVVDVMARYRRLVGEDVYFLTGTDEHGQNIERAARDHGISPQEHADQIVAAYPPLYQALHVTNDDFIRTTEARHAVGVEAIIARIAAAGDLYVGSHDGWYCASCEAYYTEKELAPGNICPTHETPTEWRSEENLFFRLSKYQDALLRWYDEHEAAVQPESRRNEVRAFVEAGLRDLSVSRHGLTWGIPFPEHAGHTVYVWLDALTNYISALGFGHAEHTLYDRFWAHDGDSDGGTGQRTHAGKRIHVVGKDILRFHAIYWPAFLMSAGLPLPTSVVAHGWWLRDQRKVSKSSGNVVDPGELIEHFGADPLRYFLLREMVFGQDASFSDEAFVDRYNSDLANDLGNTVSRVLTLSRRAFDGCTPPSRGEGPLETAATEAVASYRAAMDDLAFHRALEALWRLLSQANQFLVAREPWKKMKDPDARDEVAETLWNVIEATRIVASGLTPFMPEKSEQVLTALGASVPASVDGLGWGGTGYEVPLPETAPLFPRIDKAVYLADAARPASGGAQGAASPGGAAKKETKSKNAKPKASGAKKAGGESSVIDIDQFFETELRVANVLEAEAIPKSNKLLKLTVDAGEEAPRTVVAGVAKQYQPEELVGKQVVIVFNLKPAKLMGVESNGMVLAASEGDGAVLVRPIEPVTPGTRVR